MPVDLFFVGTPRVRLDDRLADGPPAARPPPSARGSGARTPGMAERADGASDCPVRPCGRQGWPRACPLIICPRRHGGCSGTQWCTGGRLDTKWVAPVRDSQVAETMTRAIARARARARVARHRDGHGLPRRTHGRRRLAVGGDSDPALRAVRAEQVSAVRGQEEPHVRSAPPTAVSASGCRHLADVLAGLANGLAQTVADASVVLWKARQPFRPAPTRSDRRGVAVPVAAHAPVADGVSRPLLCLLTEPADRSAFAVLARGVDAAARPRAGGDGRGRPCVPAPPGRRARPAGISGGGELARGAPDRSPPGRRNFPYDRADLAHPASPVLVRERDIWSPTPPGAWSGPLGKPSQRRMRA
jgi:hypothetical protein